MLSQHTPTDVPLPQWYRSTMELPLTKFIDCIVDKNLSALTIAGYPNPEVLQAAWNDIQLEYADAIGTSEHKIYQKKLAEVTRAQIKLKIIEDMIELLGKIWYGPFAERLDFELKVKLDLDYTKPEEYNKKLKNAFTRSRGLKISLDLMQIQFKAIEEKFKGADKNGKKSKEPTREYFYSYLYTLSDYAKYEIKDTISTYEFCTRINRYSKYCDEMEKLYKK